MINFTDFSSLIFMKSALSGSGIAFVYQFLEALADGGVHCGLSRELSQKVAVQTVLGAAKMCEETGKHPGELKGTRFMSRVFDEEGLKKTDKAIKASNVA